MTNAEINAAIAKRKGWVKRRPTLGSPWFIEDEGGAKEKWHGALCFTTATAEWCELLENVLRGGPDVYFQPFTSKWCVGSDDEEFSEADDLYTAVALAWLEMRKVDE